MNRRVIESMWLAGICGINEKLLKSVNGTTHQWYAIISAICQFYINPYEKEALVNGHSLCEGGPRELL